MKQPLILLLPLVCKLMSFAGPLIKAIDHQSIHDAVAGGDGETGEVRLPVAIQLDEVDGVITDHYGIRARAGLGETWIKIRNGDCRQGRKRNNGVNSRAGNIEQYRVQHACALSFESRIACRREPAPASVVLVTMRITA